MILSIAGFKIFLDISCFAEEIFSEQFLAAIEPYKVDKFCIPDFTVRTVVLDELPSKKYPMENRGCLQYYEEKDRLIFEGEYAITKIDFSNSSMVVSFCNNEQSRYFGIIFLNLLKLLLSIICIEKGGLPLHCSAVSSADRSKGYVFSGLSGAGKTTIALLLSSDWTILNDEFNIILPANGGFSVHATPFSPLDKHSFCNNVCAPVNSIFFLNKDVDNYICDLSISSSYFLLLESTYTFPTTKIFCERMLGNIETIISKVPCKSLYFRNTAKISEYINTLS